MLKQKTDISKQLDDLQSVDALFREKFAPVECNQQLLWNRIELRIQQRKEKSFSLPSFFSSFFSSFSHFDFFPKPLTVGACLFLFLFSFWLLLEPTKFDSQAQLLLRIEETWKTTTSLSGNDENPFASHEEIDLKINPFGNTSS